MTTMNINISYRCWPIVWVRKGQAEFLWLLPTCKILEWNFWLPQQPAMKIIRAELCTMLVVASSMFFSLRCGTRTRSCPEIYRTLINFGNNSHCSLLIHSSVCWPWIDDDGYGYAGCENVYSTRIGAAAQVLISFLFYMSVIGTDWECRQLTRNVIWPLKLPFEIVFLPIFVVSSIRSRWNHKTNAVHWSTTQIVTQFWYTLKIITSIIKTI